MINKQHIPQNHKIHHHHHHNQIHNNRKKIEIKKKCY
jgi:hypothetical protein